MEMIDKIIVRKSKPSYFSLLGGAVVFYYAYNSYSDGNIVYALVLALLGLLGLIHVILLVTTPLLVQKNDSLIIKPKIPFEKKTILIEEIKDVKANSESQLIIYLESESKIKLDLGGFKKKEVEIAKKYLLSLR